MDKKIFISAFNLNFHHPQVQEKFISQQSTFVIKCSPIFVMIACIISFITLTCFLIYSNSKVKTTTEEVTFFYHFELYLMITICSFYFLIVLASFLGKKSSTLEKWLNYLNYFFASLEFLSIRTALYCLFEADLSVYYLIFVIEFGIRVIWHLFHLMEFCESFILIVINYLTLGIFHGVMPIPDKEKLAPNTTIMYTMIIVCLIITTYFYIREKKKSFYYNCELERKNKWYENVLDNMNSGFMLMKNNTISFINKNFIESISKIMTLGNYNEGCTMTAADQKELKQCFQYELVRQNILSNTPQILDIIMANLQVEDTLPNPPQSFDSFCTMYKSKYCNCKNYESNTFNYIGRGEISQNELTRNFDQEQTIAFELACRYYSDLDGDNFELIFNDISRTKLSEEKSAEFKYKTLFLSKVAHEFKNPIICIIELADQLTDEEHIEENNSFKRTSSRMENLFMIKSLSDYLLILIKDLDYFSEFQNSKKKSIQIITSEVDLDEIITFSKRVASAILKKNHKEKVITLTLNKSEKLPQYIMTDEIKLKQVLINLLSNAIKFTSCGSIVLGVEKEITGIKFTVSDTGVGISESQKQNIFKPFNKLNSKGNALGTGLGLSIVFDMTSHLGTPIEFSSEVNKGSMFWFSIPVAPSSNENRLPESSENLTKKKSISPCNSSSATLVVNDLSLYLSKEQHQLAFRRSSDQMLPTVCPKSKFQTSYRSSQRSAHSSLCPSNNSNNIGEQYKMNTDLNYINFVNLPCSNIIVADDESLTRQATVRVITTVAKQKGIELNLIQVEDGVETLFEVCKNTMNGKIISCIISDENMTYLDGRKTAEILKSFQSEKNFPKIPFFLLTAYESLQKESYLDMIFTKPLHKSGVEEIFRILNINS